MTTISRSQLIAAYMTDDLADVHFDGAVNGDLAGPRVAENIYLNKPTDEPDDAMPYLGTSPAVVEALSGITNVLLGNICMK